MVSKDKTNRLINRIHKRDAKTFVPKAASISGDMVLPNNTGRLVEKATRQGFGLQEVLKIGNIVTDETPIILKESTNGYDAVQLSVTGNTKGTLILRNQYNAKSVLIYDSSVSYMNIPLNIGSDDSADSSAVLELQTDSNSKGFLPPRLTTTQKNAISSPATGLMVYDTTLNKLCVYTGSAWETVTSA